MSLSLASSRMPAMPLLPAPPLPGTEDRWALFLDVDGTLLDFADRPDDVRVEPALYALLAELYAYLDGALALVSGRSLANLDALFGAPPWAMAGLHGLQLRHADGERREARVSGSRRTLVLHAAESLAREFPGVLVENKDLAVALHCRTVPAQFDALHEALHALMPGLPGYELQAGNLVLELKPIGMDKGKAVTELLERAPFAGRLPVYLGDDLTDEHGFAATNLENGISVRVGDREPSLAQYTLPGPSSAQAWLHRVLNVLKQGVEPHAHAFGGNA